MTDITVSRLYKMVVETIMIKEISSFIHKPPFKMSIQTEGSAGSDGGWGWGYGGGVMGVGLWGWGYGVIGVGLWGYGGGVMGL